MTYLAVFCDLRSYEKLHGPLRRLLKSPVTFVAVRPGVSIIHDTYYERPLPIICQQDDELYGTGFRDSGGLTSRLSRRSRSQGSFLETKGLQCDYRSV